jgi:hypothetical protein
VTASDADLERAALAALFAQHEGAAAEAALARDGWFDLVPDDSGWDLAGSAVRAVTTVAFLERASGLLAHLAANSLLAAVGRDASDLGSATVITDCRRRGDVVVGLRWPGDEGGGEEGAVIGPIEGRIGWAPADAVNGPVQAAGDHAGSTRFGLDEVTVPVAAIELLSDDTATGGEHEARLALLVAADSLGAAERCVGLTNAYVRQREAFGAPLGAFQVIQHRLVDMQLAVTLLSASVTSAARRTDTEEGALAAWAAKSVAARRAVWVVEQAVQLHGGIGFTWERGLQHSLLRAQRARHVLGGPERAAREVVRAYRERDRPTVEDWARRDPSGPGSSRDGAEHLAGDPSHDRHDSQTHEGR